VVAGQRAKEYTNGTLSIVSMKNCGAELIGLFAWDKVGIDISNNKTQTVFDVFKSGTFFIRHYRMR